MLPQQSGLVEARGSRSSRSYHLSSAVYRRLGEKADYIRTRGFEPIQREQMVLQYVKAHGSISRAEVMELCKLGKDQAYRLIRKLFKDGLLARTDNRGRGCRYKGKAR